MPVWPTISSASAQTLLNLRNIAFSIINFSWTPLGGWRGGRSLSNRTFHERDSHAHTHSHKTRLCSSGQHTIVLLHPRKLIELHLFPSLSRAPIGMEIRMELNKTLNHAEWRFAVFAQQPDSQSIWLQQLRAVSLGIEDPSIRFRIASEHSVAGGLGKRRWIANESGGTPRDDGAPIFISIFSQSCCCSCASHRRLYFLF